MRASTLMAMAFVGSVGLAASGGAGATNLVENGEFENNGGIGTDIVPHWNAVMGAGLPDTGITDVPVYSGLYALSIGDDSLKEYNQVIATVPGATYIFSYAYQSDGEAGAPSSLQTWFGDQLAQNLGEIAGQTFVPATSQFQVGDFWWDVYSGSFAATGATTLIRLLVASSHPDFYYIGLDAVSVVQANSVPVPGTPALLGLGMILGVVWSRRAT